MNKFKVAIAVYGVFALAGLSLAANSKPTPSQKEPPAMTPEMPIYVPDIPKSDPRIAKYSHQVLNVVEFGAVGDGNSHPLSETFADQEAVDAKFGPNLYTLKDEADFVGIMEAIRIGKACADYGRDKRAHRVNTIYLPRGTYLVNRTIPLIDIYGITIRGDGRMQSEIRFYTDGPLFAIARSGFLAFREFTIKSKLTAKSIGFLVADTMSRHPGKPTYKLLFDGLDVRNIYEGVRTTGLYMTDSMNFRDCRFWDSLTLMHLKNPQGMVYNFYGCDFEVGSAKALAPYKPEDVVVFNVEAGGDINLFGGDIIHGGTTLMLKPSDEYSPDLGPSASINHSSGTFNFYGVRWEQSGRGARPVLFDARDDGHYRARINYDNCIVYQRYQARESAVGLLHAGMNVTLRNCSFNGYARIRPVTEPGQARRRGVIILDNTSGVTYKPETNAPYHHIVEYRGPGKSK